MIPITFLYVNGIFFADYFSIRLQAKIGLLLLLLFSSLFLISSLGLNKSNTNLLAKVLSWLSTGFFFITLGFSSYSVFNEVKVPKYTDPQFYTIVVQEQLKSNVYQQRYYGTVVQDHARYRVLLHQPLNNTSWYTGQSFIVHTALKTIPSPKNPYQFDYGLYLSKKKIYGMLSVD